MAYANAFTEGNRTAVADMAGCGRGVFYSWFKGDQVPRIDTLLRTWYQLKLPVACLVDGACPGLSPEAQAKRSLEIMTIREAAPKRSPEQIHRALEAALHEEPAPSLNEIARRLGYGTTTRVRNVDSDLCRQIVLRHRKSGRSHWWRRRGAKPICELSRIRTGSGGVLGERWPDTAAGPYSASLGYAVDGSLRQKFPELCHALSARIAEQKRMRVAAIEPALEQALQETPPPSLRQMAKRLGFSAACLLKAHSPALYEQTQGEVAGPRRDMPSRIADQAGGGVGRESATFPQDGLLTIRRHGVDRQYELPGPAARNWVAASAVPATAGQARQDAVRAEIREIVRTLHAQGICPSVPRVTSRLKSGSLREWRVVGKAVTDARKELLEG